MPERRQDSASRDRLDELEQAWLVFIAEQDARYRRVARWLIVTGAVVVLACAAGFVAFRLEGSHRRSETCRSFERQELAAVRTVVSTYHYLDTLPVEEHGTALTRAIVRGLPAQYTDAAAAKSPSYCDADGVGLPETGPAAVPKLPPPPCPADKRVATCRDYSALLR